MRRKISFKRLVLMGTSTLVIGLGVAAFAATHFYPKEVLHEVVPPSPVSKTLENWLEPKIQRVAITNPIARKIVKAAHAQEGDAYNASYKTIAYPGGDVPRGGGACTDVVVRALRGAGYDLQQLIHEDMKRDFRRYPDPWKLGHTDPNIDHRRVPNHFTFFEKYGKALPLETTGAALKTWQPGDIVEWHWADGKWHTGIVSDGIGPSGKPMVIHNAMRCTEQDYLDEWPISGHFRFPK